MTRYWQMIGATLPTLMLLTGVCARSRAADADGMEFFERKIRPVLAQKCYACHSAAVAEPAGGLRLDSREGLLKGGSRGPAVIPSDPDKSWLLRAVRYTHEEVKMPPIEKLSEEEIRDFEAWIKMGAPDPRPADATPVAAHTPPFNPEEARKFWSLAPPREPALPRVKNSHWARKPIDRFILAKLEERGLSPAPRAGKLAWLRRATFDLTGLPPTPEEVQAFLADKSKRSYALVIDRLLASRAYGERWGRHWLDLARYADTAGDSSDYPVPEAYLYRNYVIDSFNADKPYDQFLREQLAGDLMTGAATDGERWQRVVATSYLALSRRFSVAPERNMHLTIEDTIDNIGKTMLGLSISCARCHDHKYDPIANTDYYALYGFFASTRYPFAGSEYNQQREDLVYRRPAPEVDPVMKPYIEKLKELTEALKKAKKDKELFIQAGGAATADPSQPGPKTVEEFQAEIDRLKKLRHAHLAAKPLLESAFAVADAKPVNARVQRRGDPENPGDEVQRRFLLVLGGQQLSPEDQSSGRLQLAQWITDARNPLTARVMVNRIWQHHFGRGIVASPSDFGKRGRAPTHPELLDYLALRFVESGWSVKAMHRMIMLSETYAQSSQGRESFAQIDPANEFHWKFDRRRLSAEEVRDTMLATSGELDPTPGGPQPFPHESEWTYTQHLPFTAVYDTRKRSVYTMVQRFQRHPYLSLFDGADPNATTPTRAEMTTPLQALFLMNSPFAYEQSQRLAQQLITVPGDSATRVRKAYWKVFARPPSAQEMEKSIQYLREYERSIQARAVGRQMLEIEALASLARALYCSNEFMYVD